VPTKGAADVRRASRQVRSPTLLVDADPDRRVVDAAHDAEADADDDPGAPEREQDRRHFAARRERPAKSGRADQPMNAVLSLPVQCDGMLRPSSMLERRSPATQSSRSVHGTMASSGSVPAAMAYTRHDSSATMSQNARRCA
jgi:hypothetical protein